MPNELSFHHAVLVSIGIAGTLWFFAASFEHRVWSQRKRVFLLIGSAPIYVYQALGAFGALSQASSLELFGFIGCVLGVLGAVRLVFPDNSPSHASARME